METEWASPWELLVYGFSVGLTSSAAIWYAVIPTACRLYDWWSGELPDR